jgi:signal transduction histidine kinase
MRADDVLFSDAPPRGELTVSIVTPGRTVASSADSTDPESDPSGRERLTIARIVIPYLDAAAGDPAPVDAEIRITHSLDALAALQRRLDQWSAAVVAATLAASLLVAWWLSTRLTKPLVDLAQASIRVDLDRFDVGFATGRTDEIGRLSRRLQAMVERLRGSAVQLREAERRATVGDIARQVNHDIKNGLAPIRNVVRHLAQTAREAPTELSTIFTTRQGTLEASISYLESLASNYARLTPRSDSKTCDVNAVVREVVGTGIARGARVDARCTPGIPVVAADPIALRRILENLVGNAIDSLEGTAGVVTVATDRRPAEMRGGDLVQVSVVDTGRGMTEAELARAFDDFYTTKPGGTGLGLSVVRRLVADLGGVLRIETEPRKGTRVTVDLPTVGTSAAISQPQPVVGAPSPK